MQVNSRIENMFERDRCDLGAVNFFTASMKSNPNP
jgi:hypothetical protein